MNLPARLGVAAALALFSTVPAAMAQPAAPTAVTISIKDFDFSPMTTTVAAGGSVTWKNLDGEPHTVVSADGAFRSAALDQGDSFTFRFAKPGTYRYICSIHPNMKASVIVR
ncbi:MAG: cupredoxin family copper-binding protein [Caulobacteraceae bacterium]